MSWLPEFRKTLRKIRVDCGEHQADMARKLSISGTYLSKIERGESDIPDWFLTEFERHYPHRKFGDHETIRRAYQEQVDERNELRKQKWRKRGAEKT